MGTSNPLDADLEGFQRDLNINTVSAFAAMKEAVKGFGKLGPEIKKTFLFTGNKGNTLVCFSFFFCFPFLLDLSISLLP